MSPTYPFDVDAGPVMPYSVVSLAAHNGNGETVGFFVEGTDDETVALRQVELHLNREYDPEDARPLSIALAMRPSVEAARDWLWEGSEDEEYDDIRRDPAGRVIGVRFLFTVDLPE